MQLLFHVQVALAVGVLLGLVAAHFVPQETACGLAGKKTEDATEHEPAGRV